MVRRGAVGKRQIHKKISCVLNFIPVDSPKDLQRCLGNGHVFGEDGKIEISGEEDGSEFINAHLQRLLKIPVGVIRELLLYDFQMRSSELAERAIPTIV
jgi:hypothetical protein